MFVFGEPQDIAEMFRVEVAAEWDVEKPTNPIKEQSVEELQVSICFAREAYQRALHNDSTEESLDILLNDYDELFTVLATTSENFRNIVLNGTHVVIGSNTTEQKNKYKAIVESVS
jgi:hypothetical protein